MGHSLTDFKGHGFWTRDPAIEAWLGALVVALQTSTTEPREPWLEIVLDDWTLQSVLGANGCVAPDLDWHLCDAERVALVLRASRAALSELESATSELVTVEDGEFLRRVERVCSGHPPPAALRSWILHVGRAFVELLDGSLVAPLNGKVSYFVGASAGRYLGEIPELVVHHWFLDAARSEERRTFDAFVEAMTHANPNGDWVVELQPISEPGLAKASVAWRSGAGPALTLLASSVGGFLFVSVPGFAGTHWSTIVAQVPAVRGLVEQLADRGWRYVPGDLVSGVYDGPSAVALESRTWGDLLLGEAAALLKR